jgi:hypothetical protein
MKNKAFLDEFVTKKQEVLQKFREQYGDIPPPKPTGPPPRKRPLGDIY